jgi:hypothetical protein
MLHDYFSGEIKQVGRGGGGGGGKKKKGRGKKEKIIFNIV